MAEPLSIAEIIRRRLADRAVRFVFPSGVAAGFWAERSAMMAAAIIPTAIDLSRFVAWDDFKAATMTAESHGRRPADAIIRSLFAASFLAENAAAAAVGVPLLRDFILPAYAGNYAAYVAALARTLPALDGLIRRAAAGTAMITAPVENLARNLADWRLIHDRYARFLLDNRLFEPAWERTPFQAKAAKWILFFPELADDWPEYEAELVQARDAEIFGLSALAPPSSAPPSSAPPSSAPPSSAPPSSAPPSSAPPLSAPPPDGRRVLLPEAGKLRRFASGDEEIDYLAATIRRLVEENGLGADDIVVSVPEANRLDFHLRTTFRLRGITADCRTGRMLADYPIGRLFAALADCRDSRWSFRAIKGLLLDPAFCWKTDLPIDALIDFGLKYRCVAGFRDNGRTVDVWTASFDRFHARNLSSKYFAINNFYIQLKQSAIGMLTAASFRALRERLIRFESDFLDKAAMDPSFDLLFSRAVEELRKLGETAESLQSLDIGNPYALFVQHLTTVPYVFQSREPGIRIYDYRVAAGIAPAVHFVLNATQEAVSVRIEPLSFLREDRRFDGLGAERDLSAAFLEAYRLSGGAVVFTAADHSFNGPALPHAKLLEPAFRFTAAGPEPRPRTRALVRRSPDGKRPLDLRCSSANDPDLRWRLKSALIGEAASVSPSDLNEHAACPFAWLLGRGLGIAEKVTEIATVDQKELGTLYHRILEAFFKRIKATDELGFSKARLDDYRGFMMEEIDTALATMAASEGAFQESVYAMLRNRILSALNAYLDADADRLNGALILDAELPLSMAFPEAGLTLAGRADLVAQASDGGFVIVDFKTGRMPTAKELRLDETGGLGDYQLAAYIRLVEDSRHGQVSWARFFSLDRRRSQALLAPDSPEKPAVPMDRERYADGLAAVDRAVGDIAATLASARFPVPPPAERAAVCGRCGVANVCRLNFAGGGI